MCNEFARARRDRALQDEFDRLRVPLLWDLVEDEIPSMAFPKRHTVLLVPVDPDQPEAGMRAVSARWGMLPAGWAKPTADFKYQTNNARAENFDDPKSMWSKVANRRGLIAVDRFFEYEGKASPKTRWAISLAGADNARLPVAFFPAVWTTARPADLVGEVHTCANITGGPVPDIAFHDRVARMVDLRAGLQWCDLAGQGLGALKATPPAGTYHLAQEPRPQRAAAT